ncbi:hypothetical protein ABBQ38_010035 [Trebouxia sp. C0009 RCD-2024]
MVEIKLMDDIVSGPLQLGHNRGNELASFMVRQYCGTTLCTQYCLTMDDASSVPLFAPQVVHAKHAAETDNAFTGVSALVETRLLGIFTHIDIKPGVKNKGILTTGCLM